MRVVPVSFKQATAFVAEHHRHHKPPQGWKFGVGLQNEEGTLCGVVMAGRPVARMIDHETTLEVIRLCTDGTPNACSRLYAAVRRIAREMGYQSVITYTLASEDGASLRASGWREVGRVSGESWNRPSRSRTDAHPTEEKIKWEGLKPS